MLKRKSFWLISLIVLILLTGCSSNQTESENGKAGDATKAPTEGAVAQGITDDTIYIGHLGPQTGPAATYDLVRKGIESYFKYVNENGGVHGRQLKLVAYDDQYQPAKTVQLARRLVEEDRVFAMLANVCTPCTAAALDYYVEKGIPLVMLSTGASQFVEPPIENLMGMDTFNYRIEAKIFLDYAVNELGAKKIAIAYQGDDFGREGYDAIKSVIGDYQGVEIVEEVNFLASDSDFSSQAQKLQESNPDVIISYAIPSPAANLKKAMYRIGLDGVPYIVASVGGTDINSFSLAGEDVWNGTITSATVPMPGQTDSESMKLYMERFSSDYPNDPIVGVNQLGWGAAQVLVEALKRTEGDLTWDNYLQSFYTFNHWQESIFEAVSFSENNHFGLTSVFMAQAKEGSLVPISGTITFNPETNEIQYEQ